MMSQMIKTETLVFLLAVLHGGALTLGYDLFRILRRAIRHNLAAITTEDFLYCIAASFLTFCLLFQKTEGKIRGYAVVGIALGAVIYHHLLSGVILLAGGWLLNRILKILRFFSIPLKKCWGFLQKTIENACKTGYNIFKLIIRGSVHDRKEKTQQE